MNQERFSQISKLYLPAMEDLWIRLQAAEELLSSADSYTVHYASYQIRYCLERTMLISLLANEHQLAQTIEDIVRQKSPLKVSQESLRKNNPYYFPKAISLTFHESEPVHIDFKASKILTEKGLLDWWSYHSKWLHASIPGRKVDDTQKHIRLCKEHIATIRNHLNDHIVRLQGYNEFYIYRRDNGDGLAHLILSGTDEKLYFKESCVSYASQ